LTVVTGVLIGFVFVGMVGVTVQEWQQAGWLATTTVHLHIPAWIGTWFATFPTLEGLVFRARRRSSWSAPTCWRRTSATAGPRAASARCART
jgi:hypothetical protein